MNQVIVAAAQLAFSEDLQSNIQASVAMVEEAAQKGAHVVVLPELIQSVYFCTDQKPEWFDQAYPAATHPCVLALQKVAKALGVVIPVSIFERDGNETFNSVVMLDDAGEILGVYRKSHIPDGPGYQEKYYFKPGDTGFKTWKTRFGNIGVGICWDQWFPECARAMMLQGADILCYPTAIGSEPYDESLDTSAIWQRAMQGHAVSNAVPVVAANRIGLENANNKPQQFYGHSFITDETGAIVQTLAQQEPGVICQAFDFDAIRRYRSDWGFFRDRRSELYQL